MENITIDEYSLNMAEILSLYESVGWSNYTNNPHMLENAYRNSLKILAAYADNEFAGVIRCVGDGFSIIYIQDIVVFPRFQGIGIGKKLVSALEQFYPHVYQKVILTDNKPEMKKFYESCGFKASSDFNCISFVKFNVK